MVSLFQHFIHKVTTPRFSHTGRRAAAFSLAFVLSAGLAFYAAPETVSAAGYWNESADGWRYYEDGTRLVVNRFAHIDRRWYNFDANGIMQTGWYNLSDSDIWYYFDSDGAAVIENWVCVDGLWYYFDEAGYMVYGWQNIDETWYYFYDTGALKTGWLRRDGKWYYLTGDGVMKRGWLFDGGKWYYLQLDGSMATSCTQTIDGKEYSFDHNGVWWVSGEATEEEVLEITPETPENSTDIDAEESDPVPVVSATETLSRAMAEAVSASCTKRPYPAVSVTGGYLQSTLCLDRNLIKEASGLMNDTGSVLYLALEAEEGRMSDLLVQVNVARRTMVSENDKLATKVWSQGNYLALMVLDSACRDRDDELEIAASAFDAAAKELLGLTKTESDAANAEDIGSGTQDGTQSDAATSEKENLSEAEV